MVSDGRRVLGASYRIQTGQEQLSSGLQPDILEFSCFGYTSDHGVGQTSEGTTLCETTLQRTLVKYASRSSREGLSLELCRLEGTCAYSQYVFVR